MAVQTLAVSNGKNFMERCLSRLPSGKGVPPFLQRGYLGMTCPATGVDDDFTVPPDDAVKLVNAFARR